jgi:hypothetical protein
MSERQRDPASGESTPATRKLEAFVERITPRPDPSVTAELDVAAVEIFAAFTSHGVDALLLKGAGLERLLYADGEDRAYSDVDLLVAPDDLVRAREALGELGYRNATAALGIDDVGGVVHEERWLGNTRGAKHELLIELHKWLAGANASAEVAWRALAARRTSIELNGASVPVLNRDGQAMHLATHAAQHGPGYAKGTRELALGLARWPFEVWQRAAALASEIEATDSFAAGLRLVPVGAELADRLRLPADPQRDWEIRLRDARPRGTFHLQALGEARGLRARSGVVRRALLPSRDWIAWQHPWARAGGVRLGLGYAAHLARAPIWAFGAWRFRRQARRRA